MAVTISCFIVSKVLDSLLLQSLQNSSYLKLFSSLQWVNPVFQSSYSCFKITLFSLTAILHGLISEYEKQALVSKLKSRCDCSSYKFMADRFQVHAGVFVLPCLRNSCNCFIFWTTGLSLQSRFDLGVVSSVVFVSTGGVTTVPCTNISSFEIGLLDHSRFNSGVVALIALGSTDGVTALLCISISSFEIGLLDNSVISKEMTSFKIILFCSAVMRFFGLLWQLWLCFYDTFSPICVSYICTWAVRKHSPTIAL